MTFCMLCGHSLDLVSTKLLPKLTEELVRKCLNLMDLEPVSKTYKTCRQCNIDLGNIQAIIQRVRQQREQLENAAFDETLKDLQSTSKEEVICNDENPVTSVSSLSDPDNKEGGNYAVDTMQESNTCSPSGKRRKNLPKRYSNDVVALPKSRKTSTKHINKKCEATIMESMPKMAFVKGSDYPQIHGDLFEVPDANNRFRYRISCRKCCDANNIFNSETEFCQHILQNHFEATQNKKYKLSKSLEKLQYLCSICSKSFDDNFIVRRHYKNAHSTERKYKCSMCDATFKYEFNLSYHMAKHLDIKAYQCEYCNKSFVVNSELKIHLRKHTGEKPYKCLVCEKTFSHQSNLTAHRRIHEDRAYVFQRNGKFLEDKKLGNVDNKDEELDGKPIKSCNENMLQEDQSQHITHNNLAMERISPTLKTKNITLNQYCRNTGTNLATQQVIQIIPSEYSQTHSDNQSKHFTIDVNGDLNPVTTKVQTLSTNKEDLVKEMATPADIESMPKIMRFKEKPKTNYSLRTTPFKYKVSPYSLLKRNQMKTGNKEEHKTERNKADITSIALTESLETIEEIQDVADNKTSPKINVIRTAEIVAHTPLKTNSNTACKSLHNKTHEVAARAESPLDTTAYLTEEPTTSLEIVKVSTNQTDMVTHPKIPTLSSSCKPVIRNVVIMPPTDLQDLQPQAPPNLVKIPAEYKYQCTICWKYFKQKSALSKHTRTHTGEKPYKCNLCPKQFTDPSNFKRHKRLHTKAADDLNISRPNRSTSPALSIAASDPDPDGIEAMQTIERFESNGDDDDYDDYDEDDMESYLWQDALQHSLMNAEIRENIRKNLLAISSSIKPAVMASVFSTDNPD
ncbi:uncharacterized protein [Musca autumnalis]|uniref:uncharacterized protein n=1 Tax=Musca autumnalis TaxID=221902 RepID=UPI003CF00169